MSQFYRLPKTQKTLTNQSNLWEIQPKKIGTILREADLVSIPQLDLALRDQEYFPDLRLGEILAMRGWIKSETADFFVQDWSKIVQDKNRQPLGQYLIRSGLIEATQLEAVLEEQKYTGIRFGTIAVMQGFLKSTTLDFFLMYLFPKEITISPFVNMYRTMPLEIPRNSNDTNSNSSKEDRESEPVFFEEWNDGETPDTINWAG
jgi:hypothetical protein